MRTSFIYGLQDPRDMQLKYIGKSNDPNVRLRQHINEARTGGDLPKHYWIRELLSDGIMPLLFIIEEAPVESAYEEEDFWWQYFTYIGADLLNCFRPSGGIKYLTEEARRRMATKLRRRYSDPRKTPFWGRRHSKDTRQKMRKAALGRKLSDETKRKISAAKLAKRDELRRRVLGEKNPMWGKSLSEEQRQQISMRMSGKNNPRWGKRCSDAIKDKIRAAHSIPRPCKYGCGFIGNAGQLANHIRHGKCSNDPQRASRQKFTHSSETKQKISVAMLGKRRGNKHPMWGKKHSESTREQMRRSKAVIKPCKYGCGFIGTGGQRAAHLRLGKCPNRSDIIAHRG